MSEKSRMQEANQIAGKCQKTKYISMFSLTIYNKITKNKKYRRSYNAKQEYISSKI